MANVIGQGSLSEKEQIRKEEAAKKRFKKEKTGDAKVYFFCRSCGFQIPAINADLPCLRCKTSFPHLEVDEAQIINDIKNGQIIYRCTSLGCNYLAKATDAKEYCPHCYTTNSFRRITI